MQNSLPKLLRLMRRSLNGETRIRLQDDADAQGGATKKVKEVPFGGVIRYSNSNAVNEPRKLSILDPPIGEYRYAKSNERLQDIARFLNRQRWQLCEKADQPGVTWIELLIMFEIQKLKRGPRFSFFFQGTELCFHSTPVVWVLLFHRKNTADFGNTEL